MDDIRRFHVPTTVPDAVELLRDEGALALAGGTSVAVLMKQRMLAADALVWLGRVEDLQGIGRSDDGDVRIGASVTLAELAASPDLRSRHTVVSGAAAVVANPRIRAVATTGGALVHADPRQDLLPALLVADARVEIHGPDGAREVAVADGFFRGFLETAVAEDELVTQLVLPAPGPSEASTYTRFNPASADDYPTIGVAARIERLEDGTVARLRLALGGVASTPLLVDGLDDLVDACWLSDDVIVMVAEAAAAATSPTDDDRGSAAYKRAMTRVWVDRVLRRLR